MGLFNKLKEPVFLKDNSNAEHQLEKLKEIEIHLNSDGKAVINQDIKCLEYGIFGEKQIAFELKNSHIPMYILHDVYLENEELNAQIDYLVFTRKVCFVIECKNLIGDIEINNNGDFIRTLQFNGRKKREGIYSPITQNKRHVSLMKKIAIDSKNNMFTKFLVEKNFENMYRPVVVLSNPKTILNVKFAKKAIKQQVVKVDQLVNYIKRELQQCSQPNSSDEDLLKWANRYLNLHKEVEKDYTQKYEKYRVQEELELAQKITRISKKELFSETNAIQNKKDTIPEDRELFAQEMELFQELKAYRLKKSKEESIMPYFIYNNNQLKKLIIRMPKTIEELQLVDGFSEVKAQKYGCDILSILNQFSK